MAGAVALGERVTLALGDTLGAHHPATLRAAVNLLTAYVRAGRHDMACQLGARVTGELCDTLGDDHPEARRSWSALVEACASRGHWLAELALRIDQVERLDRRLGSKAMAPLTARHRLAARMADRGLYRAAVVQQIKVLEGLSSLHDDRQLVTEARAALADFEQGAATERAQVLDIAQVRAIRHAIDVGAVERALFPRSDALV